MSEPREECYKCLNSSNCISSSDYGSIYCMTHRKFNMNSNDIHKEWERKANKYDRLIKKIEGRIKELKENRAEIHITFKQ